MYMYIAAGQGQTTPGDKILMSLRSFATSVKNIYLKSDFIQFFPWFYTIMYIAPGQGLTTPWGWNFDVNRNILPLWSFVASFKKISLKSDFTHFFFMILYMYIASGQWQTVPRRQSFDVNRNVLSLHSFGASFKKMSLKSDFMQFFSWFNTCI